jgi:hypothetical protein
MLAQRRRQTTFIFDRDEHLEQLAPHLFGDGDGRPLTALGAPDWGTNRGAKLIRSQCSFDEAPTNVKRVIDRDWLRASIDPENDLAHSPEASPSSASGELRSSQRIDEPGNARSSAKSRRGCGSGTSGSG